MYCRNCGHKLEEGDKFCSSCGAKIIVENDANVSVEGADAESIAAGGSQGEGESILGGSKPLFEPFDFSKIDLALGIDDKQEEKEAEQKTSAVEEFDWNIHTFPGMEVEKTEDVDFNWSMPVEEPEPVPAPAPLAPEPVMDPSATRPEPAAPEQEPEPTGLTAVAQHKETLTRAPEAPQKKEEPAQQEPLAGLEERLFGELDSKTDATRKQSEEMDKFFTFHKKNEEFQKLLDQEYEKIKSGNMLSEEMDAATATSEEKFATRKPEDPMEELFASSGVVKGYEPKPIETDVLERIEAAEAEKRAKEESARLVEEEKAKARKEAEEKARQEAEEKARKEAEEKARQEAEEKARQEAEEKARKEAEEKARQEAEEKARQEAEAAEKAAKEAEEAARLRLEEDAKRAADARAAQEAAEREQARMAAREEAAAAMRNMEEEEQRIKAETEAKLEEQAAKMQAEIARQEAEAAILQAEAAKKEAEEARAKALMEMQKAQQEKQLQEQLIEEPPVKTKAVNKAEILAGMATATEMVERDRAFAAAEAAAKAKEKEKEEIELPDFLGHLDEAEQKQEEEPVRSIDIFEELETIEKDAGQSQGDDAQEEVLSLEDLLTEEKGPEPIEIIEADEQEAPAQEPEQIQKPEPEPVPLEPEEPEAPQQEEETKQAEEKTTEPEKKKKSVSSNTAEKTPAKKQDHDDEEDEDSDEEETSGGKGRIVLKICLVILIIVLALEVAGVVIKVAMPNSEAAKFIDSQLNKVIQMVTGDDVEYRVLAAEEDIRTEPVQDKTELIKEEMGKNKDGNIKEIKYNADLKYDPQKDYENTDINLTQELADVTWYKDASDKQVYFDQAIVGTVIAYDSQRVNLLNYGDESVMNLVQKDTDLYKELKDSAKKGGKESMKLLQIGEIRQAGTSYFVWVSEKTGNTKTKKIYQMAPEGEMMKLTASYEL